jgi:hypothetical protein
MNDAFASVFERGFAVGHSNIKRDTIEFQFKGEFFEFPAAKALTVAKYNGYFYEAPIDALRKLEASLAAEQPNGEKEVANAAIKIAMFIGSG